MWINSPTPNGAGFLARLEWRQDGTVCPNMCGVVLEPGAQNGKLPVYDLATEAWIAGERLLTQQENAK